MHKNLDYDQQTVTINTVKRGVIHTTAARTSSSCTWSGLAALPFQKPATCIYPGPLFRWRTDKLRVCQADMLRYN